MIRKLFVATLALAACTSATKRYQQGEELAREGRPADAADRFIQALKKDGRLDSARAGLRTTGAAAITADLSAASDPVATPSTSADEFVVIDDLRRRALEVGVELAVPPDYATRRRTALDNAIDNAVVDAHRLAFRQQFDDALRLLERAANSYQPTAAQHDALDAGRADAIVAWARADTAQGHFRSAFDRLDGVVAIVGANGPHADEARALQNAALARGTRRVVVVPMWATASARRELPDDALPSLGDALLQNPWQTPPRFVALMPPDQVERDLRRLDLSRRALSTGEAARFGRELGADYVIVAEIDSVHRDLVDVKTTRRPVRTTRGADTAYVIEEGRVRLFARATFALIDADSRRWTDHESIIGTGQAPFTRARFAGDIRTLDLRQNERDLFDRGADDRTDRELVRSLVGTLSPRFADAVFAELLRRIP
jgi:tetratricopeptide (TPR) repeat protein